MLPIYNQVQLIGRAGHDVELLTLTDGSHRATLRLYQNHCTTAAADDRQIHSLIAWNSLATQLEAKVRRGDQLLVQGRLLHRKLELGGQAFMKSEIHLSCFTVLSSRSVTRSVGIVAEPATETYRSHE